MKKTEKCKENDSQQAPFVNSFIFRPICLIVFFLSTLLDPLRASDDTCSHAFSLKKKLLTAPLGSYLVLADKAHALVVYLSFRDDEKVWLEEYLVSLGTYKTSLGSWKYIVEMGVPENIFYNLLEIDRITETLKTNENSIINSLLDMTFIPILDKDRKKVFRQSSMKKNWSPKYVIDGQPVPNAVTEVFRCEAKKGQEPFSFSHIDIYLPKNDLAFLPIFIEINKNSHCIKIRCLDSGIVSQKTTFVPTKEK